MKNKRGLGAVIVAFLLLFTANSARGDVWPVQLEHSNFTTFIETVPSTYGVLMEYYASWCPTCHIFQPTYEIVANYFNADPKVKPEVVVARVDCATQAELCNRLKIGRYPTLKYGPAAAFKEATGEELEEYPAGERTAIKIIKWIGELKSVEYNYDPSQTAQEDRRSVSIAAVATELGVDPKPAYQADLQDIEKATILAFKYLFDSSELLKGSESRKAFKAFLDVLAAAHPIARCREGAGEMQQTLNKAWPSEQADGPGPALKAVKICGASAAVQQDWRACKGSRENTRGYTCGLWMLLHSLAGRIEARDNGGTVWMAAVKGYVQHFFQCSDCAKHFMEMASEEAAALVRSQKEAVLWAWRAHNEMQEGPLLCERKTLALVERHLFRDGEPMVQVNRRLEAVEKNGGGGDPAFPKRQWPTSDLCPICRLPSLGTTSEVTWNEDEIYRFLLKFYHGILEPEWASQKLEVHSNIPGLGGRKSLQYSGSTKTNRHVTPLLVVVALLAVVGFFARQRMRRTRKIVSL